MTSAGLGRQPAHWKKTRVKYECDFLDHRRIPLSGEERAGRSGKFPYYGASGIIDWIDDYIFDETTILVGEDGANLVLRNLPLALIAEGKYWVNNHAHILRPRDQVYRFWAPLLEFLDYRPFITGSAQPKLTSEALGNIEVIVPPTPEERNAIAIHVDKECEGIDELIMAKENLLAILAEKRRAIIAHAVTRGVNEKARLRNSGVPWMEEIPAHWEIERSRWLFRVRDERSEAGDEELLTVSHITGVTPRSEKDVNMFEAESTVGYKVCHPGDLVINTMWAWMGAMGVAPCEGIVSPSYHVYTPGHRLLPAYVDALVRTQLFAKEVTRFSKGVWSSRLRLYPEGFFEVMFPVPPIDEQREIVDYIDREQRQIDRMASAVEKSLALLRERREAVIAAAVTGQLDVGAV